MVKNNIIPAYYRVEIDATNLGGTAPADGFIDDQRGEEYVPFPSTDDFGLAKERANMRYLEIIQQVSSLISPTHVLDIVKPSADGDTEATAFDFTLVYDRPEFVQIDPGSGLLEGADAVKWWVANAISSDIIANTQVFRPLTQTGGALQDAFRVEVVTAEKLAADIASATSEITVIQIPNT